MVRDEAELLNEEYGVSEDIYDRAEKMSVNYNEWDQHLHVDEGGHDDSD